MTDIQFVEVNAQNINDELIKKFETALRDTLYPGDERRIFLEQEAQILVGLKNHINETGKQNLLRYARDAVLDAIGERTDTHRLQAQKAKVTLRFHVSAAQNTNIAIPKGTRVTPDGKLYFATVENLMISAGVLTGEVMAEALVGGEEYNNFAPEQIKTIVDPIPFVSGVININTSAGGSDVESDDNYRERIRQAPSKFSSAGPIDAYIYWAKSADVNIQDVAVTSPSPGQVKITVLMKDGQLPSQQTLEAVLAACNDRKRRPLTDYVSVGAPTEVSYNIQLTYYIAAERASDEVKTRNLIEGSGGVIDQYRVWQRNTLGRAINPDYLRNLMYQVGVFRIDITAPVYTPIEADQISKLGTSAINYGGLI